MMDASGIHDNFFVILTTHCLETKLNHKKMGTLKFYIPGFQKGSQLSKRKRIFEIHQGKLEIIQFILSYKYMDRPGQGLRHFFSKNVK